MGIFTPDFASVDASIPVVEGRFRVKVTKKTPFAGETKDDKTGNVTENAGVRYALECVGKFNEKGELITEDWMGKNLTPFKVWVHGEGGWKYSKPFLMAANGYTLKEEQEANVELFQKGEWLFNGNKDTPTENIEIGASYETPVGKLLDVSLKKKVTKKEGTDEIYENQEFGSWAPVK